MRCGERGVSIKGTGCRTRGGMVVEGGNGNGGGVKVEGVVEADTSCRTVVE